jgi:hypothetical protein
MKFANKNILDYWYNKIIDCSNTEIIETEEYDLEEYDLVPCQKEYMDEYVKVTNKDYDIIIPEKLYPNECNINNNDENKDYITEKKLNIKYNSNNDNINNNNGEQYIRTERNNIESKDVIKRNRKLSNAKCINRYNRTRKSNEYIRNNSYGPTDKYKSMQERTEKSCNKEELFIVRKGSGLSNG